ncbi:unnamed protein product, partial [Rotaria sp. Silwood2]
MYRYLIHLFKKFSYLLRYIIKQSIYVLFIPNNWNYKSIITYIILVLFSIIVFIYNQWNSNIISNLLSKSVTVENEIIQCHFPRLSLNSNTLDFTISNALQPICRSWFYPIVIDNYNIRLILPHLNCTVTFYIGEGDKEYEQVPIKLFYDLNILLLSDYFTVQCIDNTRQNFYPNLPYASIHYNQNVRKRLANLKKNEDDFNVLILGLDSVSRLQFERMLPKTFNYITNELNGIVLK